MSNPVRILTSNQEDFDEKLQELMNRRGPSAMHEVSAVVSEILDRIRLEGDDALLELTNRLDGMSKASVSELIVDASEPAKAQERMDPLVLDALKESADRIRNYHEKQLATSWQYTDEDGTLLGQLIKPIEKVGIYVPGGKASYPSTVLMTAIPARVAGVKELTLAVPTPDGEINDALLAAAGLCEIDLMLTIGGAQAIGALAFGTETIPAVDKIVGPGNVYVAEAKRQVFGQVGIDMIAGPSEIVVIADESANPDWLAMDLFAQAEHDEEAQAILITDSEELLKRVEERIVKQLPSMQRSRIIERSLADKGALIQVSDLEQAVQIANRFAPEHLQLAVTNPQVLLELVSQAGAIFIGAHSAQVVGDYTAGPSHVLPTSGTARFSSPLGVYDFQKRSSIIQCSPSGAIKLSRTAAILAKEEGLTAHAQSAAYRACN